MLVLIRGPDCGFPILPHSNFLFKIKRLIMDSKTTLQLYFVFLPLLRAWIFFSRHCPPLAPFPTLFQRYFPFPRKWGAKKKKVSREEDWVEMNAPPPECPRGIHAVFHKRIVFFVRIINPLFTRLVWPRWLDVGLVIFCMFMDLDPSIYKHA